MGGGVPPLALDGGNIRGNVIHKVTASGAKGKVPTKVIAKSVQVSLKWLSVKNVYVFISRQDNQEDVFIY